MSALTSAEIEHFLEFGYIKVPAAVPRSVCEQAERDAFRRLGFDMEDQSTWSMPRIHMPADRHFPVDEVSPVLYEKMCALVGGAHKLQHPCHWSDAYIVNVGERAEEAWQPAGPDCPGWHVDGDFFLHFLDSPEQALLVVVLWTDVVHQGGPTYLATDSVPVIAKYLAAHPEGVEPNGFDFKARIRECSRFAEATGEAGDVYLIHPFTLHAVSQNVLRRRRIITNPTVVLNAPMRLDLPLDELSWVERKTVNALGGEPFPFVPTRERERRVPGPKQMPKSVENAENSK
jgi:hypothetical protein